MPSFSPILACIRYKESQVTVHHFTNVNVITHPLNGLSNLMPFSSHVKATPI